MGSRMHRGKVIWNFFLPRSDVCRLPFRLGFSSWRRGSSQMKKRLALSTGTSLMKDDRIKQHSSSSVEEMLSDWTWPRYSRGKSISDPFHVFDDLRDEGARAHTSDRIRSVQLLVYACRENHQRKQSSCETIGKWSYPICMNDVVRRKLVIMLWRSLSIDSSFFTPTTAGVFLPGRRRCPSIDQQRNRFSCALICESSSRV